jgi:hypothetical protein
MLSCFSADDPFFFLASRQLNDAAVWHGIVNAKMSKANHQYLQVICEKVEKSDIATIDKKKYLVPSDLTVGQFVYVIRKRIKLSPEKAIFIFVDEVLPPTAALMSSIYEEHKDEDGYVFQP